MNHIPEQQSHEHPSSSSFALLQQELDETRRLLACLIFEIQEHVDCEEPPIDILDRLYELTDQAPAPIQHLVEHLRRVPPQENADGTFTYFPEQDSIG